MASTDILVKLLGRLKRGPKILYKSLIFEAVLIFRYTHDLLMERKFNPCEILLSYIMNIHTCTYNVD